MIEFFLFRNERKYKTSITLFPKSSGRQYICIDDKVIVESVNRQSTSGDRRDIEQNDERIQSCLINWRHFIANVSTYYVTCVNEYWGGGGRASKCSMHSMSVRLLFLTVMHTNTKRVHYFTPATQMFCLQTVSACKYKHIKQNTERIRPRLMCGFRFKAFHCKYQ